MVRTVGKDLSNTTLVDLPTEALVKLIAGDVDAIVSWDPRVTRWTYAHGLAHPRIRPFVQ